jgi:hypothetical protein
MNDGGRRVDETARILGRIEAGVENLKEGQNETNEKVSGLHRTVADLVTKDDCKDHRVVLCKKFDAKLEAQAVEDTTEAFVAQPGPLERLGKKAGAIAAILGLVGMLLAGLIWFSRLIGSVERTLAADRQAQKVATKKMLEELRRPKPSVVVHQPVLVYPDAGIRDRWRRARWRRRAAKRRTP